MNQTEMRSLLEASLEDARLSRSERRDLRDRMESIADDPAAMVKLESLIFSVAEEAGLSPEILGWLRQVMNLLQAIRGGDGERPEQKLYFSPRDDCPALIGSLIRSTRTAIRVCVFTITDDRIARELVQASQRGIDVRIVSDDDKSLDLGSDLAELEAAGIPVALDREGHMHHKFAVFDSRVSVSGSYNWTRGAAQDNHESILLSHDRALASSFLEEFDHLWKLYRS